MSLMTDTREYGPCKFQYTETNLCVGAATQEMFAAWFPWLPRPLARRVIHAMLGDACIDVFGLRRPSRILGQRITHSLWLRGWPSGWLPMKQQPPLRTELFHRSYPKGYEIGGLGPHTGRQ
jgi:hypothetical protein